MLFVKVIFKIYYNILIYSQVISKDIPIIINLNDNKDKMDNIFLLSKNISNDKTNINFRKSYTKKFNSRIEEEKNERNHEEIIIRSNNYNKTYTIIETKLPNPYLNTELVKNNKYINFNFKSKFNTKFADYLKRKDTYYNKIKNEQNIKQNKTYKYPNIIDKYIYFTTIPINKNIIKTKTNKIINYQENSYQTKKNNEENNFE